MIDTEFCSHLVHRFALIGMSKEFAHLASELFGDMVDVLRFDSHSDLAIEDVVEVVTKFAFRLGLNRL